MVGHLNGRLSTTLTLGVVALLLSVAVVPTSAADTVAQQVPPDVDNTVTRIDLHENGSARWTVQVRTRLDSAERVGDYEAFMSRFEANKSRFLDTVRTRMGRVVTNAADLTGRDMHAVEFTVSTSIQEVPRRWGIVTYGFTWTDFAERTDDRLVVGDVFQGGFFLAANDTIVMAAPSGYDIEHVAPAPDRREAGVVTWFGREDFPDRHPRVELAPQAGDGSSTGGSTNRIGPFPVGGLGPAVLLGGAVLLLAISAVAVGTYRRRRRDRGGGQLTALADGEPDGTAAEAVMTDEERVITLLEGEGGRVRQSTVADELDWSASKTSRVVGRLVDQGTVEKLQLGRENLLDLLEEEE